MPCGVVNLVCDHFPDVGNLVGLVMHGIYSITLSKYLKRPYSIYCRE